MEAGKMYHIYNRGNNKQEIFFRESNYYYFLRQFSKYLNPFLNVYAYCLMPNHFHLLIRIKEDNVQQTEKEFIASLQKSFRDFFISYSKAINKDQNRTGALFQQKYKRKEITSDEYYTAAVIYIHNNPTHARLCNHPGEWKFSSYNSIVSTSLKTKICKEEVLKWFGGLECFKQMHLNH
jgi:putative transposase